MPKKRPICADCGNKLQDFEDFPYHYRGRCSACRERYGSCIRCGDIRLLEDMRQS